MIKYRRRKWKISRGDLGREMIVVDQVFGLNHATKNIGRTEINWVYDEQG